MRCFRLGSPANIAMGDSERDGRWYGDVGSGNSQIDWSVSGPSQAEAVNESGHDSRDILNDPSLYARCQFFGLCLGEHLRSKGVVVHVNCSGRVGGLLDWS